MPNDKVQTTQLRPKLAESTLSVVVPCFNESAVFPLTHEKLLQVLGQGPFKLDLLYIDDGSVDGTRDLIRQVAKEDSRVSGVFLSRNFGHQAAVTAGLSMSDGDITVVMDADLQDPPEIVPQMIELWRQGYDVVNAVRTKRKENWLLRLSYKLFYRIYRPMVDIEVAVDSGDFSLMDRKVVKAMNQLPEKNRFVRGLRSWVGFSSIQWQYERQERAAGETKYSLGRLMKLAFDGIFNFSFKPLSFLLFCGAFFFAVSVLLGIMFITSRLTGLELLGQSASAVPGFTTIAILMLFFGSVQLLSVGIVGEYLARIYQEVKDRPTFVIESVVGKEQ